MDKLLCVKGVHGYALGGLGPIVSRSSVQKFYYHVPRK
jgi:hypothetical protein